jgi:hypothetical protein
MIFMMARLLSFRFILCIIKKSNAKMRTSRFVQGVVSEPDIVKAGQQSKLKIISEP